VLFTDGEDNMSWLSERQVRAAAERANALVQVVGLRPNEGLREPVAGTGPAPPEPEHLRALRQVAELTGGRFWEAESPARLADAFAAIIEAMNTRYVLRYEPQGVQRAGWHRIELRLRGPKGDVRARRGYWVGAH
jgi:VWFA-related protein